MQKITKDNIQDYALKLMFKMKEEEFPSFEKEFETILKHMDLITEIDGIEKVEGVQTKDVLSKLENKEKVCKIIEYNENVNKPTVIEGRFPETSSTLTTDDAVKNASDTVYDEIKVPKVVGGES